MTKLEKAIKGTEICLSGGLPDRCRECPYHLEGCDRQRMQDTLELLKEQEDMISIHTVAEWLAGYAAPPKMLHSATYKREDIVTLWVEFLKGMNTKA